MSSCPFRRHSAQPITVVWTFLLALQGVLLMGASAQQVRTYRSCRKLFRDRPACCLLTTDPESIGSCVAQRSRGRQCLCHPACTDLDNCCPDFENVCPQPGNRLQAWCPSQFLDELFLDDVRTRSGHLHGGRTTRRHGGSSVSGSVSISSSQSQSQSQSGHRRKSLWEKRIARNRFPWHRLHYSIRTRGYRPTEAVAPRRHHANDAEGLPDANRLNFTDNGYSLSTLVGHESPFRQQSGDDDDDVTVAVDDDAQAWSRVRGQERRDWPWSAVGRIVYNHYPLFLDEPVQGTCTGSMIGPRHVLTAAHCLFDRNTRTWHEQIGFYPTLTNSTSSIAQEPISWHRITVPYAYRVLGLKEYDYGLIVLKKDVGNWLAFGAQSPATQKLELVGFDRFSMWRNDNCTFTPTTEQPSPGHGQGHFPITGHNCSARPGMSGAPLLNVAGADPPLPAYHGNEPDAPPAADRVVYALHTHGTSASAAVLVRSAHHGGRALKINLCVFHTLCGWLNYRDNGDALLAQTAESRRLGEVFRRSLGESCGNMHDFVPSLIRHQGTDGIDDGAAAG